MRIETSKLEGRALDWAVAAAISADPVMPVMQDVFVFRVRSVPSFLQGAVAHAGMWFEPNANWAQAGPLVEKYKIDLEHGPGWSAYISGGVYQFGDSPREAICRAVVSQEIGDEVDLPDELPMEVG